MITLTVKIAANGTVYDGDGNSLTGHMWLSVDEDGPGGPLAAVSMGFAPVIHSPVWEGTVLNDDDQKYGSTYYTGTICISEGQYTQLMAFEDNPANYGFSTFYSALTNSCIDFTWKGLEVAGLNGSGFEGDPWPTWNANDVDRVLYTYLFKGLTDWQSDRMQLGGYDVIYGSGDDDTLQAQTGTDTIYGGGGNDAITGTAAREYLAGGSGNDVITSAGGVDTLEGGAGSDTYYASAGDTILDSDGQGSVYLDNAQLIGGNQIGDKRTYRSADGKHSYSIVSGDLNTADGATLAVDGNLTIQHYHAGDLGIVLAGAIPTPATNIVIGHPGMTEELGGGIGNDLIEGLSGSKIIMGFLGDDRLYSDGEIPNEQAILNGNTDVSTGLRGNWLAGGSGNDTLVGSAGNDVLTGGGGQDLLIAGAGDDDILGDADYVPPDQDWRVVDAFPNRIYPQATGRISPADSAGDVIYAGAGKDFVLGGAGGDVIYGEGGNDYIYGNDGSDILLGGAGDDTLIGDNGDGTGVEGDDYLDGGDGSNRLLGGGGNDILIAHGGNNYLDGGEGRDSYLFDAGFGTSHIADSGAGGNAVQFNFNFAGSGIALGLGSLSFANGDELYIDNFNPNDPLNSSSIDTFVFADRTLSLQDVLDIGVDVTGSADADIFQGTGMNERIVALAGDDTLLAGGGNDSLDAGAGSDYLDGGAGSDIMKGGQGNDTYIIDNAGDVVAENLDEGIDLAQSGISYTLTDNVENLALTGAANVNGTGNALANTITGNSGINVLDGGLGADTLIGGAGNDNYVVDNSADEVVEQAGEGTDSVYASVDYSLSDNIENLNLTGTANLNGIGNAQNNNLLGNDADNTLSGLAGNDTLVGGAGNDNVLGGAGNDLLYGDVGGSTEEGNDIIDGGNGNDELWGNGGSDILLGGAGDDQLNGDSAGAGVEGDDYLDGGDGNDRLWGDGGNDTLLGGAGDDKLSGNNGNDSLNGGDGNDKLWGNSGDDALLGGAGNDILNGDNGDGSGLEGNDTIDGGDGNDQLWGNGGDDILLGGAGDDALNGDNGGTGAGNDYLDGGDGNDDIWGDGGDDTLLGGAGDDYLEGQAGNDTLYGGDGNDHLWGEEGTDSLYGGSGADYLEGGDDNDTLLGGAGDDKITGDNGDGSGMEGNDTIDGGAGNDKLWGDGGSDTLLGGDGNDKLWGDVGDGSGAEGNDTLDGGNGDDKLWGEGGNDTLIGGDGVNYLDGGDGNDTLIADRGSNTLLGGAGDDTLIVRGGSNNLDGGEGYDWYVFDAGFGVNHIADSGAGGNGIQFNFNFAGSGITIGLGSLKLSFANGDELHIDNFNPNDPLNSSSIDTFVFADRTLSLQDVIDLGMDVSGTDNADVIQGTAMNERIKALAGDDVVYAGAGNDTLIGGQGNDTLYGGAGDDRYEFALADGADIINDAQGNNTLFIGSGLTADNLEASRVGDDISVNIVGTADSILLNNWFAQTEGVNRLEFGDGSWLDRSGIEGLLNRPPVANADAITVYEDGGAMNLSTAALLANDTDPNANDVLSVIAVGASAVGAAVQLADGQVLYDIGSRFQELGAGQTLTDSFSYTISDSKGATSSSVVDVTITGVNDAPVTAADRAAVQEDLNTTTTGNVLINDTDVDQGSVLSVADAGLRAGSFGNLTLAVDGSYSYVLDNALFAVQSLAAGQTVIETFDYQATDGLTATPSSLTVTITGTNDAPVAAIPLADQTATETGAFDYQLPADAFTDIDRGDLLSYGAKLSNGNPLPDWLVFDANSRTFHSIMPDGSAGLWDISVTATDSSGDSASSVFRLDVANFIKGSGEDDKLSGTALRDVIYGLADDDWLRGAGAADVLVGGSGNDVLEGGSGDDLLIGGIPDSATLAGAPVPTEASNCNDHHDDSHHTDEHSNNDVHDRSGNNLLNGGSGNDTLIGGGSNDLLIGGTGNDSIDTGAGADIIAFNCGDGQDTVLASTGADNTLSLGSGIKMRDLQLRHLGNDLILETGPSANPGQDRITFLDWYAAPNNRSIDILQMIANTETKAGKARINQYDFGKLVERFDQAVAANATTDHWALTNAQLDKHLERYKGEALGGDLAYQYGQNGSLAAVSLGAAQDVLDSASFGIDPQKLHDLSGLKDGLMKLS